MLVINLFVKTYTMLSSYSTSDIVALLSKINARKEAYNKARKEDKEFKYIKAIYMDIKCLDNEYKKLLEANQLVQFTEAPHST